MEVKIGETLKKVLGYLADASKIKSGGQKWFLKMGAGNWVEVGQVVLYNPDRDLVVALGWREESLGSFQGPITAQPKGGGEVCIPYFLHPANDEVWVGAVLQDRKNMGGKHLCAIGGMNDVSATRDEVRKRKLAEVVGLDEEIFKPVTLKGKGAHLSGDRLFSLTQDKKKEGVRFSALEIPEPQEIMADPVTTPTGSQVKFKEGTTSLEADSDVIFMPWHLMAQKSADVLMQAGITRLMAYLYEQSHS